MSSYSSALCRTERAGAEQAIRVSGSGHFPPLDAASDVGARGRGRARGGGDAPVVRVEEVLERLEVGRVVPVAGVQVPVSS